MPKRPKPPEPKTLRRNEADRKLNDDTSPNANKPTPVLSGHDGGRVTW